MVIMLKGMKRFLFPFYREQHRWLMNKSLFRAILVLYIIALAIAPFLIFIWYTNYEAGWCYKALSYIDGPVVYNQRAAECQALGRATWTPGAAWAIFGTLGINYLLQLIFLKVFVDFILREPKKKYDKA